MEWLIGRFGGGDRFNRLELFWRELPTGYLAALAAVVVLGLVVYVSSQRLGQTSRWLLLARGVVAALLLAILLGPSLELQKAARIPPRVAVLLDVSRSMALAEGESTRIEHGRGLVEAALAGLQDRFEVSLYQFDQELRSMPRSELAELQPGRGRTDIAGALKSLAEDHQDGALAAVVVVSDGADTSRLATPEDVSRRFAEWPAVPILAVPVVDPKSFRDVALTDLRHDDFGFVRHELSFDVRLLARGFAGARLEAVLRRDGAPLMTQAVQVATADESLPVRFADTPERPGVYFYSIEVRPQPGEAVAENNRIEFAVNVGRDQLRVLLICGRPSWDERFLRHLLKKDPNVDLVSFFILRDQGDDPKMPPDELSLIPFPVNDLFTTELANFDIVILQNFNRRSFLSNLHLENLRRFVVDGGGGLMLVGGDLGMIAGGYAGSAIEDVLPFRLRTPGPESDEASFRPDLTAAGATHYITRLEPDAEITRGIYQGFPELDGTNMVGTLAPDAVALLTHPRHGAGGAPMPIFAARSAGQGRTLALTADSTWYWNFKAIGDGQSNRYYMRFWHNGIRWLAQEPSSKFLSVDLANEQVEPGALQDLHVRAFRGDYGPLQGGRIRATIEPAAGGEPRVHREGLTDATGSLRLQVAVEREGFQRVRVELVDEHGDVIDLDEKLYDVRADQLEVRDPAIRIDLLQAMASATGGRVIPASDIGRLPIRPRTVYRLAERRRIDLWDNGWLLAALVLALGVEWWLRRRVGLP